MNKAEILRYMRTNSHTDDKQILDLVDRAVELLSLAEQPKTLYRIFDCVVSDDKIVVDGSTFCSKRLCENLRGCTGVVLFGATLGTGVDRLINRYAATDIALAMAIQAAAASEIETVCDNLEEKIKQEHGVALRKRYSPGYFDLDITEQKKFFGLLQLTRRIGLTLTDTCEMVPGKSVTAFIGIDKIR